MHYVYHIGLNDDLSEGYIGVTKRDPHKRFDQHSRGRLIVGKAIRKYKLNFNDHCKILATFETGSLAYNYEKKLRPREKMGWNLGVGGHGGARPVSEETREKNRQRLMGEKNHRFGIKNSEETRAKISDSLMKKPSKWRKTNASKAGKANLGKKRNDDSLLKYKEVAINRPLFTCEYCNKTGQKNSMIAWHGENCKMKRLQVTS